MSYRHRKKKNNKISLYLYLLVGILITYLYSRQNEKQYFPLIIMIGISVVIVMFPCIKKKWQKQKTRKKYLNSPLQKIDHMQGIEFEEYLAVMYREKGYKVITTPVTNDYGADLIVKKDGKKIVVQAKRYNAKIGREAVQEVIGAREYYHANEAIVITNSFYTPNAIKLAKEANVLLIDRKKINDYFHGT